VGTTVSVRGFRTDGMAEGHYNAVTVRVGDAIIVPSHVTPADVPDMVEGGLSRMADYNQCMSVRELIDMVAYIKTLPDARPRARKT
jgi:hypothetical protein